MSVYTRRKALWKLVAVLCCVLIACAAGVQAAHFHSGGSTDQSLCALCHVAHVAIHLFILLILATGLVVVAAFVASSSPVCAGLFSVFSLFTRPPPVNVAFA
jgi:hypothetical protein